MQENLDNKIDSRISDSEMLRVKAFMAMQDCKPNLSQAIRALITKGLNATGITLVKDDTALSGKTNKP